ncbi:TPA: acyl carrier protein [Candidatus Woesearchaeota archaeon]|nr:acyl carrier protein [archaeon]HIJ11393.1 acyl carrier protein [Candidatus Woesearchaeota archaeon]|tara:strand:- start:329 stop:565 length:237 start_codon:yes stop_codon:yes gene_type:complete
MNHDQNEKINQIVCDVFHITEIAEKDNPDTIATWDSISHLQLITDLEKGFNIHFSVDDITKMQTIGMIKQIVDSYIHN